MGTLMNFLLVLLSCFAVVYCVVVPSPLPPDNNDHEDSSNNLDKEDVMKADEDEVINLKEQVHKLQQQMDEIYRSLATLDLLSKNPGMTVRIHADDRDDVSEAESAAKVRQRRDGDTEHDVPTDTTGPVYEQVAQNHQPQTWNPTYTWPLYSGQCYLCPAGVPGPRGPPGAAGTPGRDGRDGRDAPLQPVYTPNPQPCQPESPDTGNSSIGGAVYTRWGKPDCPPSAELVYNGSVAGSHFTHVGSGANYLCMPMEPIYDEVETLAHTERGLLYSSEFQTNMFPHFSALHDYTPTCAVCRAPPNRVSKLMIPGRNVCPSDDWRLEYSGYLMAERYTNQRTEFVCMDGNAEGIPGSAGNQDGALLYPVESRCLAGSGFCGPYVNGHELTCAVCTI